MLYIGYLIIVDCQNTKKNQFPIFLLLSCRELAKTASASCAPAPLGKPPPTPK